MGLFCARGYYSSPLSCLFPLFVLSILPLPGLDLQSCVSVLPQVPRIPSTREKNTFHHFRAVGRVLQIPKTQGSGDSSINKAIFHIKAICCHRCSPLFSAEGCSVDGLFR